MNSRTFLISCSTIVLMASCKQKNVTVTEQVDSPAVDVQTPVTVTTISSKLLSDSIDLNATSSFLQSNVVKSNVNGYVQSVGAKLGQYAHAGQLLFTLKTKEAESLGNTINKLDPTFHFTGIVRVVAPKSGFVTALAHQAGDYVQDGEQLAVINNSESFGFVLNVPYEYSRYVSLGKAVDVLLPDGTHLNGKVAIQMPSIDSVSQTQGVLIKVTSTRAIPENLIARVRIVKDVKANTLSLPKAAVLANESQSRFWVMKLVDSVTAVKVPVIKGFETTDRVEILSPQFAPDDQIVLTGNYGLPDTAKVKIVKETE